MLRRKDPDTWWDWCAEVVRLRRALFEAVETMEEMLPYVPDYFREKWGFDRDVADAKAALDGVIPMADGRAVDAARLRREIGAELQRMALDPEQQTPSPSVVWIDAAADAATRIAMAAADGMAADEEKRYPMADRRREAHSQILDAVFSGVGYASARTRLHRTGIGWRFRGVIFRPDRPYNTVSGVSFEYETDTWALTLRRLVRKVQEKFDG